MTLQLPQYRHPLQLVTVCLSTLALLIAPLLSMAQDTTGKPDKTATKRERRKQKREATYQLRTVDTFDKNKSFELIGSIFSHLPYVSDDNPGGFTQTYLRLSFKRHCWAEDPRVHVGINKFHLFRNFFGQVLYSTNAENLPTSYNPLDTAASNKTRYINKLDLYQRANLNIRLQENIITFIPRRAINWNTSVYVDAMAALLRTKAQDSLSRVDRQIDSWLLGFNVKSRFKSREKYLGRTLAVEAYSQMFWINPISSFANFDLNAQYAKRNETTLPNNASKALTVDPYPYYKAGLYLIYNLFEPNDDVIADKKSTALFIHLAYTSNFRSTSTQFFNSYFQAQLGATLDIGNFLKERTENADPKKIDPETKPAG